MQKLLFLCSVISVSLFSGCAVLDTSTLETARTLNEKTMEAGLVSSMNMNLNSVVSVEQNHFAPVESHDDDSGLSWGLLFGPKLDLKLTNGLDFCGRAYSSGSREHFGTRLGIKKQLYHQDKSYLALMPSFSYLKGEQVELDIDLGGGSVDYEFSFQATGLDTQLIYTYELSPQYCYSLALRGCWHSYNEVYNGVDYGPYDIWQGGLTTNIYKSVGSLSLQTELGLEFVRNTEGSLKAYIPVNVGVGYSF